MLTFKEFLENQTLLHISFNGELPSILEPRQPDGYDEAERKRKEAGIKFKPTIYSEILPPRVSFAPSIQQCFNAVYANIKDVFDPSKTGEYHPIGVMFVYRGLTDSRTKIMPSSEAKKKLWDWHLTNEIVVLSPIEIERIAKIEIINPFDKNGEIKESKKIYGHAYGDETNERKFIAPLIDYKIIERYSDF